MNTQQKNLEMEWKKRLAMTLWQEQISREIRSRKKRHKKVFQVHLNQERNEKRSGEGNYQKLNQNTPLHWKKVSDEAC